MACLSSNRVCARVQEKLLCQFLSKRNSSSYYFRPQQKQHQQQHQLHNQPQKQQQQNRNLYTKVIGFREEGRHFGAGLSANFMRTLKDGPNPNHQQIKPLVPSSATLATPQLTVAQNSSAREFSSVHTNQPAEPAREYQIQINPYLLLEDELKYILHDVRQFLENGTSQPDLDTISKYYFQGEGKTMRPMVTLLVAKAINYHMQIENRDLLEKQRQVAMIVEMIHSSSLVHDDVIDNSNFRRGKPSVNVLWNHRKVTMAGDYILSMTSMLMARLRNNNVTITLNQIITDLVQGELMQLGSKETENERFAHYLMKTFRKTASLYANAFKAVAQLSEADDRIIDLCYEYGRNIGLAFQIIDDLLDFVSTTETMGKPAAADLKLGLATAPVLFACEKYPELNPMIMRRFQEKGDVERAFELVHKSQGLEQTRFLARKHCIEAIRLAQELAESPYQKGMLVVADLVLNRMK